MTKDEARHIADQLQKGKKYRENIFEGYIEVFTKRDGLLKLNTSSTHIPEKKETGNIVILICSSYRIY